MSESSSIAEDACPSSESLLTLKPFNFFGPIDNDQEDVTAFFRRDAAVVRN
jgi:hypothetical protein